MLKFFASYLFPALAPFFVAGIANAGDSLACTCRAQGPGYETGVNIDKICSYTCNCVGGQTVEILKVKTTASSLETWDIGNHICHGQYAYRARLDAPAWQIQVKFSTFVIDNTGHLTFEESTEIASGIRSSLRRTKYAPEILEVLKSSLRP